MRILSGIRYLAAVATLCTAMPVFAQLATQTIERVKITDNDLTCAQIHAEITEMDAIVARYNEADAEARNGSSDIATGIVVDVFGRVLGAFGGVFGQIFGGVATQASTRGVADAKKKKTMTAVRRNTASRLPRARRTSPRCSSIAVAVPQISPTTRRCKHPLLRPRLL